MSVLNEMAAIQQMQEQLQQQMLELQRKAAGMQAAPKTGTGQGGAKRTAPIGQEPPSKFSKFPPGAEPQPVGEGGLSRTGEDGWVCEKCNNHNFAGREWCNRRACGAPGPWTCPSCQNKNFASRAVCNARRCQLPRPPRNGGQTQAVQAAPAASSDLASQIASVSHMAELANSQSLARNDANGAQTAMLMSAMAQMLGTLAQAAEPTQVAPVPVVGGPAAAVPGRADNKFRNGSWCCLACGNVNFPERMNCNAKSCGQPRASVDGGPPKADAPARSLMLPGSWVCTACTNVNWSTRDTCNKKTCGRPRSEVDGGAPTPQHYQARPGMWTCRHCNNQNYPERTHCNRRTCGLPRED
eukprot:TRINITY_DN14541_c0_g2_i1.p1 TRINITY_DN14541_c0_g2~~TRINITY_DN14541_c0_g2_i1.p1  ORF type:complete len:355 (-),score=73.51 TRINITY_DN14541_c0_g2_i1:380-1444(-)